MSCEFKKLLRVKLWKGKYREHVVNKNGTEQARGTTTRHGEHTVSTANVQ